MREGLPCPVGRVHCQRRPSLRYLRLEAKRRLAAGEFPALHDAQAAIARELGLPNWAALKQACTQQDSHALAHLRWMIARSPVPTGRSWTPPGEDELRQHFDDRVLAVLPPGDLVEQIAKMAADLRTELGSSARAATRPRFSWPACGMSRWPTRRRRTG